MMSGWKHTQKGIQRCSDCARTADQNTIAPLRTDITMTKPRYPNGEIFSLGKDPPKQMPETKLILSENLIYNLTMIQSFNLR
jgi:hypothetical protein